MSAPGVTPQRWMLFLHGILGSGANWRTIAKRIVAARPEWGAVLVDLRLHGSSRPIDPPHTIDAASRDLVRLESRVPGPIKGVLGHSFGGKVGLAFADANAKRLGLSHLFLIDSNPGMRPDARGSETTTRVFEMLEQLPARFPSRPAFVAEVQARGFDLPIAQWLAMNVESIDGEYRFGLDLPQLRALLEDYFTKDYWRVIEAPPCRLVIVNGGASNNYSPEDKARAAMIAANNDLVELHVVPGAGHWVHAEAPDALVEIVTAAL
ncbi:MAG: alpha/beta fold hydrolase [Polyangiales bacterium]